MILRVLLQQRQVARARALQTAVDALECHLARVSAPDGWADAKAAVAPGRVVWRVAAL